MEDIAERLSKLENLYFPRALQPSSPSPSQRKSLLRDLLSRDLAVFLERYGTQLTFEELKEFEFMKDDYEINWHLNNLRSLISPTTKELRSRSKKIKNRRRAYLDRLICDGKYFSEDAMREREPYLHHEYVGKFQDPSGRRMARPGERWSETLMRRSEEAILVEKIRGEQQRLGVAQRDWVGNEREQQEEEEEEDEDEDEERKEAEDGESLVANGTSHPLERNLKQTVRSQMLVDDFNLCGLSGQVPYYDYALDLILDVESSHGDMFTEEQNELVESAAEMLYGLIHVRYVLTSKEMAAMLEKYTNAEFGRCPRVYCCGQPCLPVGQSDIARQSTVKIYCPKCEDIYSLRSRFQNNIDGAYFGTTFSHLFLMTCGHLKPQKVSQSYVPRVFGFKIHKP
ncbi:Casein kinase II subunit beta-2 [Camellia lanceoleosa]|nr:Casein kinase II subunit beta-2 [Camellia lanceoleosa]